MGKKKFNYGQVSTELSYGAVATFTKIPTSETLTMIRKLVEEAEKQVNKNFVQPDVSGNEGLLSKSKDSPVVAVCEHELWMPNKEMGICCKKCGKQECQIVSEQTDR